MMPLKKYVFWLFVVTLKIGESAPLSRRSFRERNFIPRILQAVVGFGGVGMAQWLSMCLPRRSPTTVARVWFPDSASNVGWVFCWFSSLLREVFLRVLRFFPVLKNQHFQIQIRSGIRGLHTVLSVGSYCYVSPSLKKVYLFIYLRRSEEATSNCNMDDTLSAFTQFPANNAL